MHVLLQHGVNFTQELFVVERGTAQVHADELGVLSAVRQWVLSQASVVVSTQRSIMPMRPLASPAAIR